MRPLAEDNMRPAADHRHSKGSQIGRTQPCPLRQRKKAQEVLHDPVELLRKKRCNWGVHTTLKWFFICYAGHTIRKKAQRLARRAYQTNSQAYDLSP